MANVEIIESKETENLMKDEKAFLLLIKIGYKTVLSEVFDIPPVRIGWAFLGGAESVGNSLPKEYFTCLPVLLNSVGSLLCAMIVINGFIYIIRGVSSLNLSKNSTFNSLFSIAKTLCEQRVSSRHLKSFV